MVEISFLTLDKKRLTMQVKSFSLARNKLVLRMPNNSLDDYRVHAGSVRVNGVKVNSSGGLYKTVEELELESGDKQNGTE